jgi:hypothetical protein
MRYEIDIKEIRKNFIKKMKGEIKENNYSKIVSDLKEDKTTIYSIEKEANGNNTINISFIVDSSNTSLLNDPSNISLSSTLNDSKINPNVSIMSKNNINNEKTLNSARAAFCLKHNLYDKSLSIEYLNFNHPPKYKINDIYFIYLYPNDIKTFCLTASGFLFSNDMVIDSNDRKVNDSEYNLIYGIYFCNKNVEVNIGDKCETKKCGPNSFICSMCMKVNKIQYKIKSNYLININGRIAKKNKGSYHCFGHFQCDNQIKDCITKYTCKACKLLNYYSKIYS